MERIFVVFDIFVVTGQSDWFYWVEDVFNNVFNEYVDILSDVYILENRLKGGGKGVFGLGI